MEEKEDVRRGRISLRGGVCFFLISLRDIGVRVCGVLSSEMRLGRVSCDWRPPGSGRWLHTQQVFVEHL